MNWWGRRSGLLLLFVVVLFSCEEEVSTIGIRRPNSKFRVNYAEIDIPSSVVRFEKLATYNRGLDTDGVQRLLVGQYQDNSFGKIRTEIYTQISPPVDLGLVGTTAVFDSLVLQLKTDYYYYGSSSESNQTIEVHELIDTVKEVPYFNTSKLPYKSGILGQKTITINPDEFKQGLADNSDNITTNDKTKSFRVVLTGDFATNLFETLRNETAVVNDFEAFTGKYKGFAILPSAADKVLGIDAKVSADKLATGTKLVLYYTEAGAQKQVNFTLYPFASNPVMAFSSIESDRSGTILAPLTEPFKDFFPPDDKLYVQSGIGIITKLDFATYFKYMDTVKNAVLNSAELVFENEASDFAPPAQFQFKVLDDENKYRTDFQDTLTYESDLELQAAYANSVTFGASDGSMDLRNDQLDVAYVKPGATNTMAVFLTNFFQDQYIQLKSEKRIKYASLHPIVSQFRKSVNRIVLSNNVKLKIYYTTPVVETIE